MSDKFACNCDACEPCKNRLFAELEAQHTQDKARIEALEGECKRLWALLDNISTAGDAYKPDHTPYFKYVNGECEKRDGLFYSDGYTMLATTQAEEK